MFSSEALGSECQPSTNYLPLTKVVVYVDHNQTLAYIEIKVNEINVKHIPLEGQKVKVTRCPL